MNGLRAFEIHAGLPPDGYTSKYLVIASNVPIAIQELISVHPERTYVASVKDVTPVGGPDNVIVAT